MTHKKRSTNTGAHLDGIVKSEPARSDRVAVLGVQVRSVEQDITREGVVPGGEGGEVGHGVHEAVSPGLVLRVCHEVALDVLDGVEDRFQHSVRVIFGIRRRCGQQAL